MKEAPLNILNLANPSVRQFKVFLKALAENDLWEEIERDLVKRGCRELLISIEPIRAIQELLRQKIAKGHSLTAQAKILPDSACRLPPPRPFPDPHPPDPPGGPPGGPPPGPPTPQ